MTFYNCRHTKHLLFFLVLIACGVHSIAQQQNYSISKFSTANGLVSSEVLELYQDSNHYLWIGHAAGVSRYDGFEFENLLFAANERLGSVHAIAEDLNGRIWIGSDRGLFLYSNDSLCMIPFQSRSRPVYALLFYDAGLWLGTSDGPAFVSNNHLHKIVISKSLLLEQFILTAWSNTFPSPNPAISISIGNDKALCIGDGYAVYMYASGTVSEIWRSTSQVDQLRSIVVKNKDSIIICSSERGIQLINRGNYQRLLYDHGTCNELLEHNGNLYLYASTGVYSLDHKLNATKLFSLIEGLAEWGTAFMLDKEGNFWLGSHDALAYAKPLAFTIYNDPPLNELYSIAIDKNNSIQLGGIPGALVEVDPENANVNRVSRLYKRAPVTDIFFDNDVTWITSWYEGITLIEKGGQSKSCTKNDGLRDNSNFFFLKSAGGRLFTGGDAGLTEIIRDEDGEIEFKNYRINTNSSDYVVIKSGLEIRSGIFFGSNRGLFRLLHDTLVPVRINGSDRPLLHVTDMVKDADGRIFISSVGEGIWECQDEKGTLKLIKRIYDSPAVVLDLMVDKRNQLWAVSNIGVTLLSFTAEEGFHHATYGPSHGFVTEGFHTARMAQDSSGMIWIATSSGLLKFDGGRPGSPAIPRIVIRSVSTHISGDSIFLQIANGQRISHKVDVISFSFTGIHFSDPGSLQFQYRLLGSDEAWMNVGENRSVSFQQLPPGEYIFQVRTKTSAGHIWSTASGFTFTILPAFWQRWWFIPFCMLVGALIMIMIMAKWSRILKKRAKQRERVQAIITESLQHSLEIEQVVNYFSASLADKQTADEILWDVARNCIAKLGFEDCVIYMTDEQKNVLIQKAAWGPKTIRPNTIFNPIEIRWGQGIVGSVAANGKGEIVNDTIIDPRYIIDDKIRRSEIAVPIKQKGKVIGVIDSEHSQKGFYSERHLQLLNTIAALCSDKLTLLQSAQERQAALLESLANKQKATEARLQSLRLQMNPHFLFNALNSIQQMILAGDEETATRNLSKFSRLLRMVLMQSEKERISLREELEVLKLYVDLESVRFRESFHYSITCEPSIDIDESTIPTLLVQPFVENAIWHGLLHKAEERILTIHFFEVSPEVIGCLVEDNGIGRKASGQMKQFQGKHQSYTSKGISVTTERLKFINEEMGHYCGITIEDIMGEDENAMGTRVIIKFPA